VLKAMGGKWHRHSKGHVFDGDPTEAIELASLTGEYTASMFDDMPCGPFR
jgi:hypothetical protein